jgi:hypothetical protein
VSRLSTPFRQRRALAAAALAAVAIPLSASTPAIARPVDAVSPAASHAYKPKHNTPGDFGTRPVAVAPKAGDTPVDFPGASRAPQAAPQPPIQVVRPERTIIRDDNPTLPLILAGLALLVALSGGVQVLSQRRVLHTRAH